MKLREKIYAGERELDFEEWISLINRPLVFTNGCFDILHRGHIAYLQTAASLGAALVVGVNSDESVQRLGKGEDRPINPLEDRMAILAALECIDAVISYNQDTPLELILRVKPQVLVKGGDWKIEDIVGGKEVEDWGGTVHSIEFEFQRSTTALFEKIRRS